MQKFLFSIALVFLGVASSVVAEEEAQPLDPGYEGVHGMVLVSKASTLYAYHMPTYSKPHDAQILYKVGSKMPAVTYLVKDAEMVTIKPQPFNLQRLMRGERLKIVADVYMGHFERGGMLTYEKVELSFDEQLYVRMLNDIEKSSIRQKYDSVSVGTKERILIHQLTEAPSFDHLVLLYEDLSCITEFDTRAVVPGESELLNRLSFCGPMKPLYFETMDFQ